jgi:hypothetical protein
MRLLPASVAFLDGSSMRDRLANSNACSLQCAAQNGLVVADENRYTAGFSQPIALAKN